MKYNLLFLFLLILTISNHVNGIVNLKILTHLDGDKDIYEIYVDEFNKYSKKNGLNIRLNLNAYTKNNSTATVESYEAVLESQMNTHSTEYDLYYYDNIFTKKFGPHLLPLNEYIPPSIFDLYKNGVAKQNSIYDNKWVALPIKVDATFLYCNQKFLNKYNRPIPTTWGELLETAKYISEKEKALGNANFIAYNGLFARNEMGTCSIIEFFHSFRDSVSSPFPSYQSQELVDALEMMKKLKNEIASDDIFQSEEATTCEYFYNGNFLFQKYWYKSDYRNYEYIHLPGKNENVSGSALGGYNLAINKYISDSQRKAAIEAFKFITSRDMQKLIVTKYGYISGIPSLYMDEEVCSIKEINCPAFQKTQLIARPTEFVDNYSSFSERYRNFIYDFLYGSQSAKEVLKKVDDISKIHQITVTGEESYIGLFNVITVTTLSVIMLLSSFLLYHPKFQPNLQFLSNDFWVICIIGSCLMMHSIYSEIGEIQVLKCHLKPILLNLGFTLNFIPIFHRLVVNFPEKNRVSSFACHHRYLFFLFFLAMDLLFYSLYYLAPYDVRMVTVVDGKVYFICKSGNGLTKLILYSLVLAKVFLILLSLALIFLEWHLRETSLDLKFLLVAILTDLLCCSILFILTNSKIQSNDFLSYYTVFSILVIIFSIADYFFLYGIKLMITLLRNNKRLNTPLELQGSFKAPAAPVVGDPFSVSVGNLTGSSQSQSRSRSRSNPNYTLFDYYNIFNLTTSNPEMTGVKRKDSYSSLKQKLIDLHNKESNNDISYDRDPY